MKGSCGKDVSHVWQKLSDDSKKATYVYVAWWRSEKYGDRANKEYKSYST